LSFSLISKHPDIPWNKINTEFFRLACSFQVNTSDEETSLSLSGLSENMGEALCLVEELMSEPVLSG